MESQIRFTPKDVRIVREDGWEYPLKGILSITHEMSRFGDDNGLVLRLANVSDETLESVRVLRDEFPRVRIELETNY